MGDEELLTVHEAAQLIGVTDTAIRNAITRGRLEAQSKFGRIVLKASDVQNYKAVAKPGRPPKSA